MNKIKVAPPLCPMLHDGGANKQKHGKKTLKVGVIFTYCTGLLYCFPESVTEKARPLPVQDKSI